MKKLLLYISASAMLFISACEEEITLDLPPNDAELVIEGYMVDLDFYLPEGDLDCSGLLTIPREQILFAAGLAAQFPIDSVESEADYFPFNKVKLTTTSDYFANDEPPTVSGATVKLLKDGNVVETLLEDPELPGVYRITHDPDASGEAYYHLEIDALGNFYETTPELYAPTPPLLGVTANYGPNFLADSCAFYLGIDTYEKPGLGDNYRWMYYINNEYVDDPVFITTTNDDNFDGLCLFGLDVYGNELQLGDTITVFQLRVNEGYANFLSSLQNQTAFVGSPFDTPPAPIQGNLKNVTTGTDAFGYFSAGGISANLAIVPDEIPDESCL